MTSKEIVKAAVDALEEKKGTDLQVIEIADLTVIAEYFVLCTGTSTTQIKTLIGEVEHKLKEMGEPPLRLEGYQAGNWAVLDYGSVIVHIFNSEMREFYKLERLWADGKMIDISTL